LTKKLLLQDIGEMTSPIPGADLSSLSDQADRFVENLTKLPAELTSLSVKTVLLAGAAVAGAILLFLLYRRVRRSKRRKAGALSSEKDIVQMLQRGRVLCDLLMGPAIARALICRFVIAKAGKKDLQCEMVEDFASDALEPGRPVLCTFKPVDVGKIRRNAFETTFLEFGEANGSLFTFFLKPAHAFTSVKRRRYKRKRVKDQQFVRAKLWATRYDGDPEAYLEAPPALAINAFDMRAPNQEENSLINISPGGLGLTAAADLVDQRIQPGADLVVNIFLFNIREKGFKPYWYAGKLRSAEEQSDGTVRIGVEFQRVGSQDSDTGDIVWELL
jgi:hypothetical protein